MQLRKGLMLFMSAVLCTHAVRAEILPFEQRPQTSAYISVGDCLWAAYLTPVGNRTSIEVVFDTWKDAYKVTRVFWRGMQDEMILDHMKMRHLTPVFDEFYSSCFNAYKNSRLNEVAVEAAHARGMKIWGYHALFDYGGSWQDGVFTTLPPYYGLDELIELNPRFSPIDKRGHRKGGGTICFAYPEVRDTLVKRYTDYIVKYNYDGVMFMTYVENYSQRFNDEFGYNQPIVAEFKKRYGVDIRTEKFDKVAWHKLRGEYLTMFLSDLRKSLNAHGKQVGILVSERNNHYPQPWSIDLTMYPAGNVYLDWENWIRSGAVDELLMAPGRGDKMIELITEALDIKEQSGSNCKISFYAYGAGPKGFADDSWNGVVARGAVPVIADGAFRVDSGRLERQPAEALRGDDPYAKLAVLNQMVAHASNSQADGIEHGDPSRASAPGDEVANTTEPNPADMIAATEDPHFLVKRRALLAIGELGITEGLPALEKALTDPEIAIRAAALISMRTVNDAHSPGKAIAAVRQTLSEDPACFAFQTTAVDYLADLSDNQFDDALSSMDDRDYRMRMLAPRSLFDFKPAEGRARRLALPGLLKLLRTDTSMRVRYSAAWALGSYQTPEVIAALTEAMKEPNLAVQQRAAASLPHSAGAPFAAPLSTDQKNVLDLLKKRFRSFDSTCTRGDKEWGWRAAGNALVACGDEGKTFLEGILADRSEDLTLRRNAFFVLRIPQTFEKYYSVTDEQDDRIWQEWPE